MKSNRFSPFVHRSGPTSEQLIPLLRQGLENPHAEFRPQQLEAIKALCEPPGRVLLVQATGWGKSLIYFLATHIFRKDGRGPTLVVSPLLSLMRNQIASAEKFGLHAQQYTSANTESWSSVEAGLAKDRIDILFVSPERLANPRFESLFESTTLSKSGLLVVDEAHCISEWGHDFRPDYRRLGRLIRSLPPRTSVLATTATANDRVVRDVLHILGENPKLIRGSLARENLRLQAVHGLTRPQRLAWLDTHLPDLPGSGIIYTLTTGDSDSIAGFLKDRGYQVEAYHSRLDDTSREQLEGRLIRNQLKALVATVALGMGFDKPDLGFVVHYQSPSNWIAAYQQIGRAGRAIAEGVCVLFLGEEDEEVHQYFIQDAFPDGETVAAILQALERSDDGLSEQDLCSYVNSRLSKICTTLKILASSDPQPVQKVGSRWRRTAVAFQYDRELAIRLQAQRLQERKRLVEGFLANECLMLQMRRELSDPSAKPCGVCATCLGRPIVPLTYRPESLHAAETFLSRPTSFEIKPRTRWYGCQEQNQHARLVPIPSRLLVEAGFCLSRFSDGFIGDWVKQDKQLGHFRDELVQLSSKALEERGLGEVIDFVTAVPSLRSGSLVPDFASRLANRLGKPYVTLLRKHRDTPQQKTMQNSHHQWQNLVGAFEVVSQPKGNVLLVDDMVDSGWTFTILGALLREAGAPKVIPFALTSTSPVANDD
jgi:ATP-dependent DNA helicase RecQ